jgi:SSS family solute:Na+ symporter
MSTVAGALNSTATLVSVDIVKRLRPQTNDRTLVRIGQITAVAVMLAATAWSTQGERFGGIFKGINQMISDLAPPITTVFLWGVFWKRGTACAALTTLIAGFLLGAAAFVLDFPAMSGLLFGTGTDGRPVQWITNELGIPFMLQAWWLFVICSAIFVATSLLSPAPPAARIERTCWSHPLAALRATRLAGPLDPRLLTLVLLGLLAAGYALLG